MLVKIIEALLISTAEYKKIFGTDKPTSMDLILIVGLVRETVENVLWNMFLESAEDDLHCLTNVDETMQRIKAKISLTEQFYNKHFGRLTEEQREKELNELITRITEKLDKINWREVIQ